MTALNKQALRQLATDAHELGIIKRYTKGIEANKRFIAAASPVAVLSLLDENLQLQRDKDSLEAVSIAMRDDMRDAREKLEAADKTSAARLEAIDRTHKMFQRERDRADAAEKRIAELEARTVQLPPTLWYEHDYLPREIPVLSRRLLLKALREAGVNFAAGIGVKGE
ncbi:ead/Ea22-like family protein [Citrobacter portucalensis]|uniref:ead/Ea22-like family protein n=1 Tax=Citrobacter portucalensis TaxID=1639133 RepID=UPI0034DDB5BA